jgi:exopolysaccharide biosynthesis WecB/TagA/CpsF family protein
MLAISAMSEILHSLATLDPSPGSDLIIGGIRTAPISRRGLVKLMVDDCLRVRERPASAKLVFSLNAHGLSLAAKDANYRACLDMADIVHADGASIVFASRLLTRAGIPERSATTDMIHDSAKASVQHGLRFYLLGGTEAINAECANRLREMYPGLQISGRHHGYFSFEEEPNICSDINASRADVVWIGLGKPTEQFFCLRNRDRLRAGWLVTCGGCFNYITGAYSRAPLWMQSWGLEWLHRMLTGPRQLIWRYLTTNPHALYLMLTKTRG